MQSTQAQQQIVDRSNYFRSPQGSAARGMQEIFLTESKKAEAPGIPIASEVSSYLGTDILSHKNKTQISLYKNIIKSEGANDFIQKFGTFKHNAMATASYIGNMAVEAVQFGMQNVDSPVSIEEVLRLNTLLSKIQALNYTEEDSIEIAYIIDNYKQEIGYGKSVGMASRDAYTQLNKIFDKAALKDKEDFLSNSKSIIETIIDPALIIKSVAHGSMAAVDQILNIPYRIHQTMLGDDGNDERVTLLEDLAEEMFNISKRDLRKISESRVFRTLHGLPGMVGLSALGGSAVTFWNTAKVAGAMGALDFAIGAHLSTLHEKFGMSPANFDALTTTIFLGMALGHRMSGSNSTNKNITGEYNFKSRKGLKFDLFEGESTSPSGPKEPPKTPRSPGSVETNVQETVNTNTPKSTPKRQSIETANIPNVQEFDMSGDVVFKKPRINIDKFDNYEPVSQRAYVDSNSMTAKDGGVIDKLQKLKEDTIPIDKIIDRTKETVNDVLLNQNYEDPQSVIKGLNETSKAYKKSMNTTYPDTPGKRNYVSNVINGSYGEDASIHHAALNEGNLYQVEAIEEGLASGDPIYEAEAKRVQSKLNESVGDHFINEAIGDSIPYTIDENGASINMANDVAEFRSHSAEVKKSTVARFADDLLDSVRDTTTQGYLLFEELETKYKQMLQAGMNATEHKEFALDLLVELDKKISDSNFNKLFSEVISKSKNRKLGPTDLQSIILEVAGSTDGLITLGGETIMPLEFLFDIKSTAQKMKASKGFIKSGEWRLYNGLSNIVIEGIDSYFNFVEKTKGFENFSELRALGDKRYHSIMTSLDNIGLSKAELMKVAESPNTADVNIFYGKKDKITNLIKEWGLLDKANYMDKMSGSYRGSTNLPRSFNAYNASFRLEGVYDMAFSTTDGIRELNTSKLLKMHSSQWMQENGRMLTASERKIFNSMFEMANSIEKAHQTVKRSMRNKNIISTYGGKAVNMLKEVAGFGMDTGTKLKYASDPVLSWMMFLNFLKIGK